MSILVIEGNKEAAIKAANRYAIHLETVDESMSKEYTTCSSPVEADDPRVKNWLRRGLLRVEKEQNEYI